MTPKPRTATTKIAKVVQPAEIARTQLIRRQVEMVLGEVSATGSTLSVKLRGETEAVTGVAYLASYSPTVGDIVYCLMWDACIIVIGTEA